MNFDDIPENKEQSYPCECGGNITKNELTDNYDCDSCDVSMQLVKAKLDFEEWFEQSDEDPEYIGISRTAWYAGQENV